MTREEIIEGLYHIKNWECNGNAEMHKVVVAAIEALEQEPVLDKIRAEILDEAEYAYADFEQYKVDYLGADAEYVEDELPQDDFRYGMERAIEIIDKYKVESEGQA